MTFTKHANYILFLNVPPADVQRGARLAQLVEHDTLNLRVVGSSPTMGGAFFFVGLLTRLCPSSGSHQFFSSYHFIKNVLLASRLHNN